MGICGSSNIKKKSKKGSSRYQPAVESSNKNITTPMGSKQHHSTPGSNSVTNHKSPKRVYKDVSAPHSRRNSVQLRMAPGIVDEEYLSDNYSDLEILTYSKWYSKY